MLTGEAKKIYQREYMRRRRANTTDGKLKSVGIKLEGNKISLNVRPTAKNVRPNVLDLVRPDVEYDADGYPVYEL